MIVATGEMPAVEELLAAHHALMRAQSPEESCHVMASSGLRAEGAQVYALSCDDGMVLAVGALKPLTKGSEPVGLSGADRVVELKSMHVAAARRGFGLGHALLSGLLGKARLSGATGVCLETGSAPEFAAARALYKAQGFAVCPPFGAYTQDPLSVFMWRRL